MPASNLGIEGFFLRGSGNRGWLAHGARGRGPRKADQEVCKINSVSLQIPLHTQTHIYIMARGDASNTI